MSWAESLEAQILSLWETEPHKAWLIAHKLRKIADSLEEKFKPAVVEYWQTNKELPAWYIVKETNRTSYDFTTDPQWQLLKSHLEAREAILKQAVNSPVDLYDTNGEKVTKVHKKETAVFSLSQK